MGHKHQEIVFVENFADENSQHEFTKIEIEHLNGDGDLINPKGNPASDIVSGISDNDDIVSDLIYQSVKNTSLRPKG